MPDWRYSENTVLVAAILPRATSASVIEFLIAEPGHSLVAVNARGTLIKDRWYQSFLPVVSPEQEILHWLVPENRADQIFRQVTALAKLWQSGSGAIYLTRCPLAWFSANYPEVQSDAREPSGSDREVTLRENLISIVGVVRPQVTTPLTREAVQAGAPGPTVNFGLGRGISDRLGLLRFTQNPEKEIVQVIVDEGDAKGIFETMAEAGQIDEPGRGILYIIPVAKGLINLPSVYGSARYAASIQQIIQAVDDLHGSADWRAQHRFESTPTSRVTRTIFGRQKEQRYLLDMHCLTCIAPRKFAGDLTDAMMAAGAPATTATYGRWVDSNIAKTASGIRLNEERVLLQVILPEPALRLISSSVQEAAEKLNIPSLAGFTQEVPRALTYLG